MQTEQLFNPCFIIPVYNHEKPLPEVIDKLRQYHYPCIIIDDGSSVECAAVIQSLVSAENRVSVLIHKINLGKGAAIKNAIKHAYQHGYSHALQVDADGQHSLDDVPRFLEQAQRHPQCIVIGTPLFDESIPKIRLYSRYLTHIWVWINTLSFHLKDTMCGFRVYPVALLHDYLSDHQTGNRMEFDIEILVKLFRQQACVESISTHVNYPQDGISHFRLWRDNYLISKMHASLFFSLLYSYIPQLLKQNVFKMIR
ncbi:MAG: glycosyltransferase family 2 protein [Gammaproteobacteria bacterium]|nr:glycosyltransferase family 2 protein [Gammaproteobacteria bacterium]